MTLLTSYIQTLQAVVKDDEGAAFSLFDEEGDELLDVYPGDEYYQAD